METTHPCKTARGTAATDKSPRLFNDDYFDRVHSPALFETWHPFARLPVELRLQIWLTFLRQHRMIEITIVSDIGFLPYPGPAGAESRYFAERNHLGRLISGRDYSLDMDGRDAATFNPLLGVNRESRHAALWLFYRVHLPFPGKDAERVLYLNPDYDVFYLRPKTEDPEWQMVRSLSTPQYLSATVLADFLHDVKAFDPGDQGVIHVALHASYFDQFVELSPWDQPTRPPQPSFSPALLHPVSAASFTEILRSRLRSVLCPMSFADDRRVQGGHRGERYTFAEAFPLRRRDNPTGAFRWLESDPRPGVKVDLQQLTPKGRIPPLVRAWKELEKAFDVGERSPEDPLRLYACLSLTWPRPRTSILPEVPEPEPEPNEFRGKLAQYLHREAEQWESMLVNLQKMWESETPGFIPSDGMLVDAETSAIMEKTPRTTIGMWLFPIEAFKEPMNPRIKFYDLSAGPLPGLFLFDV